MFYIVQFLVNLILFSLVINFSGIPKEYSSTLCVIMVICNVAGYIEGVIYENLDE